MKLHRDCKRFAFMASTIGALSLTLISAHAQTTWTNTPGGEWNDVLGWNAGVPNELVAGTIPAGNTVTYDLPMAAGNIRGLTLGGTLAVNTNGFNIDLLGTTTLLRLTTGGLMTINSNGVVTITNAGVFRLMDRNTTLVVGGGTLLFQNNFGAITIGENGSTTATLFNNDLGSITVDQSFQLRGYRTGFSMTGGTIDLLAGGGIYESSSDSQRKFYIGGGTANLGDFLTTRTQNGVAQAGLVISNGVVNFTSLRVGTGNAACGATVAGGVVTNTGPFLINDRSNGALTSNRRVYFYQLGGSIYSTDAAGIIVVNQSNALGDAADDGGYLDIRGGLLLAEGITLVKDATLSNARATLDLSGGEVYLGSVGLVGNVGVANTSYTMNLNGGTLGAQTDFAIVGDGTLGGDFTLKAANQAGDARNITHNGVWSGAGALTKTGSGTLTLLGNNTFSGNTTIAGGTLALGVGGDLSSSARIEVAEGATFDVSAKGTYALNSGQTLGGSGSVSGSLTAQSGSTISPGLSAGELTFANNLTIQAGATTSFGLSATTNDVVSVAGTLDISGGTSTVLLESLGQAIPIGTYTLFKYGTLNGSVANLVVAGVVTGTIQHDPVAKTISVTTTSALRGPTNVVWVGDSVLNVWDAGASTNWVNNLTSVGFLAGDDVMFDSTGSTNPPVNLVGDLTPNSVTVDATVDYTFAGTGKITGLTGLTKTNSGTLTMLAQNDYVGVTTIAGGTLSVSNLVNGGFASPIGAATADAANLVFNGGTLQYLGTNLTWNRGLTLGSAGGGLSVADANTTLITTGAAEGEGTLVKKGAGWLDVRAVNNHTGGTEIQAGTLRLANSATLGSGNLSLNGGATEAVFQFSVDQQTVPNTLSITGTNNATSNSGNNTFNGLIGDGTVYLRGTPNTLTFNGDMSTFSGRLVADGVANLRLRFNPIAGSSNAVFDLGTDSCLLNNRDGNVTIHLGALLGGPSTSVQGASVSDNPSTYVIGALGLDTLFEGTISESTLDRKASIVKVGSGTLTLSGSSTYTGDTTISQGTLALTGSAGIGSTANITVSAGATLDVSGLLPPLLYLNSGQTLSGDGTVNGSIETSAGGTLAPGTSLGTLTVTGDAALQGTTVMEINRAAVPNADKLVAATILLGGTLVIQNSGFNLLPGDTFDLFDAATINNLGVTVQGPQGVVFDTSQLAVNGTITVTTVPVPPQITGTSLQGGTNLVTSGIGGPGSGNYRVFASTNVVAAWTNWTPVQTNVFEFDGSFSFTNAVDPAKPTEFFLIQPQ